MSRTSIAFLMVPYLVETEGLCRWTFIISLIVTVLLTSQKLNILSDATWNKQITQLLNNYSFFAHSWFSVCLKWRSHTCTPQHDCNIVSVYWVKSKFHIHIVAVTPATLHVFTVLLLTLSSSAVISHGHLIAYFILLSSRNIPFFCTCLGREGWGCKVVVEVEHSTVLWQNIFL